MDETPRLPFVRPFPAGVNIPETRRGAYLRSVEISGPHNPTGAGEGQSRKRIFVCSPSTAGDRCRRVCENDPVDADATGLPAQRHQR